jgi:predicted nucleic acid-binding protein
MTNVMPNSLVCVDASFIVRLLVPDRFSEQAERQWTNWLENDARIIAPTLILFEVSAALRLMVFRKALSPKRGDEIFNDFRRIDIFVSHEYSLRTRAWQLAKQFNQPRSYDMAYVALAQLDECPFWTADERLYNSVRHELAWVHWIGTAAASTSPA